VKYRTQKDFSFLLLDRRCCISEEKRQETDDETSELGDIELQCSQKSSRLRYNNNGHLNGSFNSDEVEVLPATVNLLKSFDDRVSIG
jgi:hypothetical protein